MFYFTKAEADVLGFDEFDGGIDELAKELTNAYYVLDDAPFPYWERAKYMTQIEKIAAKYGVKIGA